MKQIIKVLCLVLSIIVYSVLLGFAQEPFTINDNNFLANYKGPCGTDAQIKSVNENSFGVGGQVSIKDGQFTLWCYDAKHTWIGKLRYAGYTFDSDKNNPLQFVIDKDKGYLYVKGKGTVTLPSGKIIKFP